MGNKEIKNIRKNRKKPAGKKAGPGTV